MYPSPLHDTIVGAFAGGAGYELRHYTRRVILIEKDPTIAALWRWLITATPEEVRRLPLEIRTTVRDLCLPAGPAALIGFWCNKGCSHPVQTPSAWMRSGRYPNQFWGTSIRERVASQVGAIRHWSVIEGDFEEAPDILATWFVDPPYERAGKHYRTKFKDYVRLASWCRRRRGQVMVCENEGAKWLPFSPLALIKANESKTGGKRSAEVLWHRSIEGATA